MAVKKKAVEFRDYTPIEDEISVASAYVQAATALDKAAEFAVESRNAEQLAQIAMVWIEMGTRLGGSDESDEEEDEGEITSDHALGFQSPAIDAEIRRKREMNDN